MDGSNNELMVAAPSKSMQGILGRLGNVQSSGMGWSAQCPAHEDERNSLSIGYANDGRILVHCHAGCSVDQIVCSLGLTLSDLFPPNGRNRQPSNARHIVSTFDYHDSEGNLLFQVVRYDPKGFAQRRPDGSGGWHWNLDGVPRVLYRLPELIQADAAKPGFICEGEKDADCLRSLGLVATTNPGGAGKWQHEYAEWLRGRHAVIPPDNDEAGARHAAKAARSLQGIAASIKVLRLPNLPPKGDVSDWVKDGGTPAQLQELAKACPQWKPTSGVSSLIWVGDVQARPVSWLWDPYMPLGKLTGLVGDPGVGKSFLSLSVAASVSLGHGPLGLDLEEPRTVLVWTAEDDVADTVRPRLESLGANLSNVAVQPNLLAFTPKELGTGGDYECGLEQLHCDISEISPALVVIDPLTAFLTARINTNQASQLRAITKRLAQFAAEFRCSILLLVHLNKAQGLKPLYRTLGSIDLPAVCRSVLGVGEDPDNPSTRVMVHLKSNLAPQGKSLSFSIRHGVFGWLGTSSRSAYEIFNDSPSGSSALGDAEEFLREVLSKGECPSEDLHREARSQGISRSTLFKAKKKLSVNAKRDGQKGVRGGGEWLWCLPGL